MSVGGQPHNDLVEVYTIASNSWVTIPAVSGSTPSLYDAQGATWKGDFYIFGGLFSDRTGSNDIFLYHAENQTFSVVGTMPTGVRGCAFLFNTEP